MSIHCNGILIGLIFSTLPLFAQTVVNNKLNTSGAESYFEIASALQAGDDPNLIKWNQLFNTPVYEMMIMGGALDTTVLKSEMSHVFYPVIAHNNKDLTSGELYHKAYRDNQDELEKYVQLLHTSNVVDSIKSLLYSFIPKRLQQDDLFPTLLYVNYGAPEATGYGGVVVSDLLLSYKIDNYKFGLLTAHEAFHSIVSMAFQRTLKKEINYSSPDLNLLYFLQNINEEGIADLIDKPLLAQRKSPLFEEVKKLTEDDESTSTLCIKKLDSLLTSAYKDETVIAHHKGFASFTDTYGKMSGHIPGRFMATVIKEGGLLEKSIQSIEDPVSFVISYNEAIKKHKKWYARFSEESIQYLKKVRAKYCMEQPKPNKSRIYSFYGLLPQSGDSKDGHDSRFPFEACSVCRL